MSHAPTALARRLRPPDPWSLAAASLCLLMLAPLCALLALGLSAKAAPTGLAPVILTTAHLVALTVGLALVPGVACGWLVALCRFPGRRLFDWALVLPMAMPAYVSAYAYTDLLDYAGPVQTGLRDLFGWTRPAEYWFPALRTVEGAAALLALVLYPYVYVLARDAFRAQAAEAVPAARALGRTPAGLFWGLSLRLARPALVAGAALVALETLNDLGTVGLFEVNTLTWKLAELWRNRDDVGGAALLALGSLGPVLLLLAAERAGRRGARFDARETRPPPPPFRLTGAAGWLAALACAVPLTLGFLLPVALLLGLALGARETWAWLGPAATSLSLAAAAALTTVLVALALGYAARLRPRGWVPGAVLSAGIGYAVPGAVLALAVVLPLARLDNLLFDSLVLTGSGVALVYGYTVRFLALAQGSVAAGLARITPTMDQAARALGAGSLATLWRVHAPLLRPGLLTAGLLVFVDVMKELPMTEMLRPPNLETLATLTYAFARDENLTEAAPLSLLIVAVGLVPVLLLSRARR